MIIRDDHVIIMKTREVNMQNTLITFQSIISGLRFFLDFLIIWVLVYYVLKIVRNNSRTVQIFKGIIVVVFMWFLSQKLGFTTLKQILDYVMAYGLIVVVIIFQPEIRSMLERLGKTSVFSALHSLSGNEKEELIDSLVEATMVLSDRKTGALITLEQGHSLADYIKTGNPINSSVSAELLTSIFVTSTPLHDGAVIIQGDRIACASAYFPPTNQELPVRFGARHRAAIGISEITDSITIVVSEETGTVSIAEAGKLKEMDEKSLREYLNLLIQNSETEVSHSVGLKRSRRFNLAKINVDPIKIEKLETPDVLLETDEDENEKKDFSKLINIFKKQPKKASDKKDKENEKVDEETSKETVSSEEVVVEDKAPVVDEVESDDKVNVEETTPIDDEHQVDDQASEVEGGERDESEEK